MEQRVVLPEILDSLPADHPAALANRRDLRLVNACMGTPRWFRQTLPDLTRPGDRILEIGAGTGDLGKGLRNRGIPEGMPYTGLDLWPKPDGWPGNWSWEQADLSRFSGYGKFSVLLANLILHQFSNDVLRSLGNEWRDCLRVLVVNEPVRRRLHQWQLKLLRPLGFHPVSRHDGHVSVAAGFRREELPRLLGLGPPDWSVSWRETGFGAYRMAAVRRDDS